MKTIISMAIAIGVLTGCGGGSDGDNLIDLAQRDENQRISRDNAMLNGKAFARKRYGSDVVSVVFDSDSTISLDCPLGDGWATGNVTLNSGEPVSIKCQTFGSGKGDAGCLTKEDFIAKPVYANQDGNCDKEMLEAGTTVMLKQGL